MQRSSARARDGAASPSSSGIRAGARGPEVKIAWNAKGRENAQEGYHRYPSPGWFFEQLTDGVIRPDELDHVGMTNEPNIKGAPPWTNSQEDPNNENDNPKPDKTMLKKIALLLGIAENSEEAAVTAEIQKLKTAAGEKAAAETAANDAKTQLAQQKTLAANADTAKTTAENDLKVARADHAKTLLDMAINEGRITQADRATHEAAFVTDFEKARTALAGIKKGAAINTASLEIDIRGSRRVIANTKEASDAIQAAVNDRMAQHKEDYNTAWNAVKADAKYKALFDKLNAKEDEKKS
jgi:hypothetical protein